MQDQSNARLKRLLNLGRNKHKSRPSNPTPAAAGPPYPAPSPSSFGHYFNPSNEGDGSAEAVENKRRSFASMMTDPRKSAADLDTLASSKRRTGFKSLYETANQHCISLFQQLELCKADFTATDKQLSKEREHGYLLHQRLQAADDAQRQIIADRETQERIAMNLSGELEKERLRLSEARAQLASLNRDKADTQRKYTSLKDAYRSQRVALSETTGIVKDLEGQLWEKQRQTEGMRLLQEELAKMQSGAEASQRERQQLRKQVDRNEQVACELQEQLNFARTHLASLENENVRVSRAVEAAEEHKHNAEERLDQAEEALKQTLEDSSATQSELERQLAEVRAQHNATNQRAAQLASELESAQEVSADLHGRLEEAEVTLPDAQQLVDQLQGNVSELRTRNQTLEAELEGLREQTELTAASHLDRVAALETELHLSHSAHDATASARDSAVAQLEALSSKNDDITRQLHEFEASSHALTMELETARAASSQMQSTIGGLQDTVGQLEQARDALVAQAAEQAQKYQQEVADLESRLEQAEEETKQTRATTTQQLETLKGMNSELAEKLIDLKETRNQHATAMRARVAELTAQIQASASLHDRMVLENQTLEESVAELKATVDEQACHLTQAQRDVTFVQVELETARQDLRTVTHERDAARDQLAAQAATMQQTDAAIRALRSALGTARSACHGLRDQLVAVAEEAMTERRRRFAAEAAADQLRQREAQLIHELKQVPVLQGENATLHERLSGLEQQLDESKQSIRDLRGDLDQTRSELQAARQDVEANRVALAEQQHSATETVHALEAERTQLQGRVTSLESANAALHAELDAREVEREELQQARERMQQQDAALLSLEGHLAEARTALDAAHSELATERSQRAHIGNELFLLESERDELRGQVARVREKVAGLEEQLRRTQAGQDVASLLSLSRRILEGCQALSEGHSPARPPRRNAGGELMNYNNNNTSNAKAALAELNNNLDLIFKYINYFEVDHLRKQRGRLPSAAASSSSLGSPDGSLEPSTPRMPHRGFEHSYLSGGVMIPPLSPPPSGHHGHHVGGKMGSGYNSFNPLLPAFSPTNDSSDIHTPTGWGFPHHRHMAGSRPA